MAFRRWCVSIVALWSLTGSGCALWHELQPHRLHRLNRVAPPHLDPEFTRLSRPKAAQAILARSSGESPEWVAVAQTDPASRTPGLGDVLMRRESSW